jgi:hypothetical protein
MNSCGTIYSRGISKLKHVFINFIFDAHKSRQSPSHDVPYNRIGVGDAFDRSTVWNKKPTMNHDP